MRFWVHISDTIYNNERKIAVVAVTAICISQVPISQRTRDDRRRTRDDRRRTKIGDVICHHEQARHSTPTPTASTFRAASPNLGNKRKSVLLFVVQREVLAIPKPCRHQGHMRLDEQSKELVFCGLRSNGPESLSKLFK